MLKQSTKCKGHNVCLVGHSVLYNDIVNEDLRRFIVTVDSTFSQEISRVWKL